MFESYTDHFGSLDFVYVPQEQTYCQRWRGGIVDEMMIMQRGFQSDFGIRCSAVYLIRKGGCLSVNFVV